MFHTFVMDICTSTSRKEICFDCENDEIMKLCEKISGLDVGRSFDRDFLNSCTWMCQIVSSKHDTYL